MITNESFLYLDSTWIQHDGEEWFLPQLLQSHLKASNCPGTFLDLKELKQLVIVKQMSVGLSAIQATKKLQRGFKNNQWQRLCHDWQGCGYLGLLHEHLYNATACQVVCVPVTVAYTSGHRQIWRAQGSARLAETISPQFSKTIPQQ